MGKRKRVSAENLRAARKSIEILRRHGVVVTTAEPVKETRTVESFKFNKEKIQEEYSKFLYGRKHSPQRWAKFKKRNPKFFVKVMKKKRVVVVPPFTVVRKVVGNKLLGRIDELKWRGFHIQ